MSTKTIQPPYRPKPIPLRDLLIIEQGRRGNWIADELSERLGTHVWPATVSGVLRGRLPAPEVWVEPVREILAENGNPVPVEEARRLLGLPV